MSNFSLQVLSNKDCIPEEIPADNSSYANNLSDVLERNCNLEKLIRARKSLATKFNKKLFEIDISSVKPFFKVLDQVTNEDKAPEDLTIRTYFDYEFDDEIPPKSTFKIKVKMGNFEKYKPKESDFENIF